MQTFYMRQCIDLANEAVERGGSPYGALIADPSISRVIATGRNNASSNPIWHGEMSAINNLSNILEGTSVYEIAPSLELYTTAEPCAMCMGAISWAGFGRVYYGSTIPFVESQGNNQIEIRATAVDGATSFTNVTVIGGVLQNETNPLYIANRVRCAKHSH